MNRTLAKISTFLALVIIVISILLFKSESSRSDTENFLKQSQKREKLLNHQYDSLMEINRIISKHYRDMYIAYQEADEKLNKAKNDLKKVKNAPVIRYTDAELDSILTAEYPR